MFIKALLVAIWVTWAFIDEQTLQLQTTRAFGLSLMNKRSSYKQLEQSSLDLL